MRMNRIQSGLASLLLALAIWGVWGVHSRFKNRIPQLNSQIPKEVALQEKDLAVLQSPATQGAGDAEVAGALRRLGPTGNPEVLNATLARLNHPSPIVRQAVASAVGYFEDPKAIVALRTLLSDPNPLVQTEAIRALGYRPSTAKARILSEYSNRPGLVAPVRIELIRQLSILCPQDRLEILDRLLQQEKDPAVLEAAHTLQKELQSGQACKT